MMSDLPLDKTWHKFKQIKASRKLIESALILYALLLDGDIPKHIKTVTVLALLYLIVPFDTVPDFTPLKGFADDLAVLTAALTSISPQIKPHHKQQAQELLNQL